MISETLRDAITAHAGTLLVQIRKDAASAVGNQYRAQDSNAGKKRRPHDRQAAGAIVTDLATRENDLKLKAVRSAIAAILEKGNSDVPQSHVIAARNTLQAAMRNDATLMRLIPLIVIRTPAALINPRGGDRTGSRNRLV